jgi:hypothetical protein
MNSKALASLAITETEQEGESDPALNK